MTPTRFHREADHRQLSQSVSNRIWRAMRMLRPFTFVDIETTAEASRRYVSNYCWALHRAGYLRRTEAKSTGGPGRSTAYWLLIRDTGPMPPMRRRDGTVYDVNEECVYGTPKVAIGRKPRSDRACRQRMWVAARLLRRFSNDELATQAKVNPASVKRYTWALARCGFLKKLEDETLRYQLIRDSGEVAPVVRRNNVVFDPNTGHYHAPHSVAVSALAEASHG